MTGTFIRGEKTQRHKEGAMWKREAEIGVM